MLAISSRFRRRRRAIFLRRCARGISSICKRSLGAAPTTRRAFCFSMRTSNGWKIGGCGSASRGTIGSFTNPALLLSIECIRRAYGSHAETGESSEIGAKWVDGICEAHPDMSMASQGIVWYQIGSELLFLWEKTTGLSLSFVWFALRLGWPVGFRSLARMKRAICRRSGARE